MNVLKGFDDIPASFGVLAQLCKLLRDEYTTIQDLAALIKLDASLSTSVLRLANSFYIGARSKASSLEEAINRIGFTEVFKMVALISNNVMGQQSLKAYNIDAQMMWRSNLATALLMEYLAYDVDENPGQCYMLGLLSAIGKWPLARFLSKVKPSCKAEQPIVDFLESVKWERSNTGNDHLKLGGALLAKWGFPENVYGPIYNQHYPLLARRHIRLACLLHICRMATPAVADPTNYSISDVKIQESILTHAGVDMETVEQYIPGSIAWLQNTYSKISQQLISA